MTTPEDLARGTELFAEYPQLGAFGAVLAAVAMNHRAEALVSADRGFARVSGLSYVELADPRLEHRLVQHKAR